QPCSGDTTRERSATPIRQPGEDKQCPSTTEKEPCALNGNCFTYSYNITGNNHTQPHTNTHTHTNNLTQPHTKPPPYTHTHAHPHTHTHTHTRTHARTHARTHPHT